jgi:murein DD-endopeptidase MepM/ murein hydrolase activator NlpD
LGTTFHSGVDIYAANGTPLYSILQGTVVDIHNIDDNDLGKSITIKSTTNIGVVYLMHCHLSEIEVKVGDEVKKGDNIGKTGITGNASSIAVSRRHVHIEASTDGVFWGGTTRIDPEQFITTKFDINGNPIKLK